MTNEELVTLYQSGQKQYIEQLYQQNTGLLKKICNIFLGISSSLEFEDLLQQSYFGLVAAAETYQQEYETSFAQHLAMHVRKELLLYIENCGSTVRVPVHQCQLVFRYHRAIKQYQQQTGRDPEDDYLCESLQISQKQLNRVRETVNIMRLKSLSETVSNDPDADCTLADIVADPVDHYEEIDDHILNEELAEKIWTAVGKLKQRHKEVIISHYAEEKTVAEIAEEKGVPAHTIHRAKKTALQELRRNNETRLKSFCDVYGISAKGTSFSAFERTWTSSVERAVLRLLEESEE